MQFVETVLFWFLAMSHQSTILISSLFLLLVINAVAWIYFILKQSQTTAGAQTAKGTSFKKELNDKSSETAVFDSQAVLLGMQIKSVLKNIINSQYVLKDKNRSESLFQTPIRKSINDLRVISERLVESENRNVVDLYSKMSSWEQGSQEAFEPQALDNSTLQVCNPFEVVKEQVTIFKNLSTQTSIDFCCVNNTEPSSLVSLDASWLSGALSELISNAVKHNNPDISLTLSIEEIANEFHIIVQDNGVGIPNLISRHYSHCYSDCQTPHSDRYRRQSDRDNLINLALIKRKLNSIGGSLEIRSAKRFLTRVHMRFPVLSHLSCTSELNTENCERQLNKLPKSRSSVPKVLWLSEDCASQDLRESLSKTFVIHSVFSLSEASSILLKFKPDCIVIDEAFKLSQSILIKKWTASDQKMADTPTITLGGLVDKSTQLNVLQTGINAVIEKPVCPKELTVVIEKVVDEKVKQQHRVESAIADYHVNSIENIEYVDTEAQIFVQNFNKVLEENYQKEEFRIGQAAQLMHTSEKTLSRKIYKYYQLKFSDLLRKYRLSIAREQIVRGILISNVAYDTGFSSPSYFTQCFKAEFGFAPSFLSPKSA